MSEVHVGHGIGMRCNLLKFVSVSALFVKLGTAFSIDCPHCLESDSLDYKDHGRVYCLNCDQHVLPNNLFAHTDRFRVVAGDYVFMDQVSIDQARTELDDNIFAMPFDANIMQFDPRLIISSENLNSILSYLTLHYQEVKPES